MFHLWIVVFASQMPYVVDLVSGCHKENKVAREDFLFTTWNDCFILTFDGYHVELMPIHTDFPQCAANQQVLGIGFLLFVEWVDGMHLHAEQY